MYQGFFNQIAVNVIAGFLARYGMAPSVDGLEVREYDGGEHIVFTVQSRAPDEIANALDAAEMYENLVAYLKNHNQTVCAVRFEPYNVETYNCCGTYVYISIYR